MDHEIAVLLGKSQSRDSRIVSIVERARLRASCTHSHAISAIEARERAIFSFHGASVWRPAADAHMQGLLYESFPAETFG